MFQFLEQLTKGKQNVLKLAQHHGAVLHLVVELQALDEVLKVAGLLGLLDVAVDRVELVGEEALIGAFEPNLSGYKDLTKF